jgi:hypothetical protein
MLLVCLIVMSGQTGNAAVDQASGACKTSEQIVAFTNVNLVPMTDDRVVAAQTVVICGETIIDVGQSSELPVPSNARIIDGQGAYLLPGLADMHMHSRADWLDGTWPVSPFDLYLVNGVTTIRDFGAAEPSPRQALIWRDKIIKGTLSGPRMLVGARLGIEPVTDVGRLVQLRAAEGYDFIKLYSFLSNQQFMQAVRTANKLGKRTVGHIPFAVGLDGVLSGGMDEIAHIEELDFELLEFDHARHLQPREWFKYLIEIGAQQTARFETADGFDLQRYNDFNPGRIAGVIDKLRSAEIPLSTTLIVGETIVRKLFHRQEFLARPENQYLPAYYWEGFNRGREKHLHLFKGYERFAQSKYKLETMLLRELHKAGVPVILATDAGTGQMGIVPGFSIHDELRILTENGFTPYEAISTGTAVASRTAAKITGEDEFGTIEYGKRADLLLVRNNPLADVANLADPIGVMAAGRWYPMTRLRGMIDFRR